MSKPLILIVGGEAKTQAEIGRALKDVAMVSAIAAEPGLNLQEQLGTNPSAVIAAAGTRPPRSGASRLTLSMKLKPSSPGMAMSERIAWGRKASISARPAAAEGAARTSAPRWVRMAA